MILTRINLTRFRKNASRSQVDKELSNTTNWNFCHRLYFFYLLTLTSHDLHPVFQTARQLGDRTDCRDAAQTYHSTDRLTSTEHAHTTPVLLFDASLPQASPQVNTRWRTTTFCCRDFAACSQFYRRLPSHVTTFCSSLRSDSMVQCHLLALTGTECRPPFVSYALGCSIHGMQTYHWYHHLAVDCSHVQTTFAWGILFWLWKMMDTAENVYFILLLCVV